MGPVKREQKVGAGDGAVAQADDRRTRVADEIRERGFAVLPGAVPSALVAELVAAVDRSMIDLAIQRGGNAFLGFHTRRIFNLLARGPVFEQVPAFEATLGIVEALLDSECLLSSLTAIEMQPGQARQPLHTDLGSHGLPRPGPIHGVVALWALSDFTRDNGGTHVVPASHRFDRMPRRGDDPETLQIEMSAGSVLFYDANLWHGGGENRSRARRLGIVANYCAGYLRQEECQLLALSREQVVGFPPRLRRLVGYGTYRGLLGHVDQQSPERLVDPSAPSEMVWSRIRG